MANIKISQLPAKGANLGAQDLVEVAEFTGTGYVSKSITGQEIIDAASGGGLSYPAVEPLNYATDAPLNRIATATSTSFLPASAYIAFQSFATNNNKLLSKFWDNAAFANLGLLSGTSITYFTVNNDNLAYWSLNYSGTYTINLNATHIGQIQQFIANCTYNLPNCTHYWNTNFPQLAQSNMTLNAPNLQYINGALQFGAVVNYNLNSLEFLAGNLQFLNATNTITSFNSSSLKYITGGVNVSSNNFTSMTLNSLEVVGSVNLFPATGANLFTTFSFNNIKEIVSTFNTATNIGLNQTSVDHILVKLAALDGTNNTALYANKTVTVYGATPSATGLAAKATLVARGCTVTTN